MRRLLLGFLACVSPAMVTLKMDENTPRGTEIARLRDSLDKTSANVELEFRIVRQDRQNGLELFEIEGSQGSLIVKQSPDRETMCPDPLSECLLKLQIVVLPQAYYQDLSVTIELLDQNDNAPRFQEEVINVEMFENSRAAHSLDNQMAYDPDTGKNGEIHYGLSSDEFFTLQQYRDDAGDHLDLIPVGNLDHETKTSYELLLIASNQPVDGSKDVAVQSSSVKLVITVLDKNEFKPKFDKEQYEFKISEAAPPGTKIGTLHVYDGDGGDQLRLSIRELTARQYFRIESNGNLYTNRKLDYEMVQRFEFWVMASDTTYSERTRVVVEIQDENDNEPSVFVAFNTPHDTIPKAGWVVENEPAGSHIAYIRAEDADSNGIGDIELLEDEFFELDKGIIKSKSTLDREEHAEYSLHIKACDQGRPQKCTKTRLIVFVRDQNDNAPVCDVNPVIVSISESAEVGAFVTEAQVSDADDKEGFGFGQLRYKLEPAGAKFRIDQDSGAITLLDQLDYEEQRVWSLNVVAEDGGGLETRCQVTINVSDANEAAPVFQRPVEDDLELLINASEEAGVAVMQAEAIDADYNPESNPKNDPVITYALNGDHQGALEIDQVTGELRLLVPAGRLLNDLPTFRLIITATDTGSPRLTTSIRLTVCVREGVETGLMESRNVLKGGATVALIAILAALTALLFIILVALAFICRHRKLIKSVRYPTMYHHGNASSMSENRPGTPNSRRDEIENFEKVHEDVSILYDSILTPRSSIGPAQLYKTDFKSKIMQKTHLEKLFKKKYKTSTRDTASESDHADSGKGESDHDTINPAGGPKCDETCLRLGHSDSCWIEEDNISQESKTAFKCSIVHAHNPSLHKPSYEKKKDLHSSGYISQDTDDLAVYGHLMSTPIKSFKHDQISSSSAASVSTTPTGKVGGLIVSNKGDVESGMETGSAVSSGVGGGSNGGGGCIIDVRGSNISSSDHLTVRDLASLKKSTNLSRQLSPKKVNIV